MSKKKAKGKSNGTLVTGTCFIIMPFGGWFDEYYSSIYQPAIRASGLEPKRADDLYRPSTIVNDIWILTKEAKVVLADLTGKNPNVFYELGLAHALAKPAILVTESMTDVPFDLRALRVIEYDKNDPEWGKLLSRNITKAIEEVLKSPLESVLPAFVDVKKSNETPTVSAHDKALLEMRSDLELLRHELRQGNSRFEPAKDTESHYLSHFNPLRRPLSDSLTERINTSVASRIEELIFNGLSPGEALNTIRRIYPNINKSAIDQINMTRRGLQSSPSGINKPTIPTTPNDENGKPTKAASHSGKAD
jgi:hypothetical protein